MLRKEASVTWKDRNKSSRRVLKEAASSSATRHRRQDKHKGDDDNNVEVGSSGGGGGGDEAAERALHRAIDMTVTGEFKRRQDVALLSEGIAQALVSRMLEATTPSSPAPPPQDEEEEEGLAEEEEGKVRFAWLEEADDDDEEESGVETEEGDEEEVEAEKRPWDATSRRSSVGPTAEELSRRLNDLKDQEVITRIVNLLLQRKIAQINMARKDTANLPESIKKLKSLKTEATEEDQLEHYDLALEQYCQLKLKLQTERSRCEEDLAQRRAYRRSLEKQLLDEREALLRGFARCANQVHLKSTGHAMPEEDLREFLASISRRFATIKTEHQRFARTARTLKNVQAKMKTLEVFGERMTLVTYEQLAEDNQKLMERIEDRHDMIGALKMRAVMELQEAAHMRDMIHGTEEDIDGLVRKLAAVDDRLEWSREEVAKAKRKRDYIRRCTKTVIHELDLLAYPHLLHHFQELIKTTEHAEKYLSYLVKAHLEQEETIRKVRAVLLRFSRRYHEKIPEKVLYSLNQRASISRLAEQCITGNRPSGSDFHSQIRFKVSQ